MSYYISYTKTDHMSHGRIMDSDFVLDITDFFRIRENRLEVCLVGICSGFSSYIRRYNPNLSITSQTRVEWICNKISDALTNPSVNFIVLDCRMENYFVNLIAKDIIDKLNLQPNQITILTATDPKTVLSGYNYIVEHTSFINWGRCYSNLISRCIDWEKIDVDIPFISLMGRPTKPRAKFAKDLLDLCEDKVRISFGNLLQFPLNESDTTLYSNILSPNPFPLMKNTDSKFLDHPSDIDDHVGDNLLQSIVNIVNETNDFDSNIIMLSEKTFKAFAWHQIPIFNATKGHVEAVRRLGFDLFDDIIDHSYGSAPNMHIQQLKILNIVSKFMKSYPTVTDVNNLRKNIFQRLQANNELLYKLYKESPYEPWPHFG